MGSLHNKVPYLNQPFGHVVNGQSITKADRKFDVIDPATEQVIASVPVATKETLDDAVKAASVAFESWGKTTWQERAEKIKEWKTILFQQRDDLVSLSTAEQGQSIMLSGLAFDSSIRWIDVLPTLELKDEVIFKDEDRTAIKRFYPMGVVAGITTGNFPVCNFIFKALTALITGNCIIMKPSPYTPLCAIRITEAAQKCFPPGVLQCIVGDDSVGPLITSHPDIVEVSFTGSVQVGKAVVKSCADTLKKVNLELGGNDVSVILPDVDVDEIAPTVLFAATMNSGQVCCASKRIYVHEEVYDKLAEALKKCLMGMKVSNGFEAGALHGPISNKKYFDEAKSIFEDISSKGYKFVAGGKIEPKEGFFAPISIVDNPPESSRIVKEEQYGPIFPLLKWKDEDDLIRRVNDSPYGLGATVWGKDTSRVDRIARSIITGLVWCNLHPSTDPRVPFGGIKYTGHGREGGIEGLKQLCNMQVMQISSKGPEGTPAK